MTNTTASIIREARQLITPPEAWTQFAFARDAHGYPSGPIRKSATCFCAIGALRRVTGEYGYSPALCVIEKVAGCEANLFNDTHTHQEVLALLDKAALAAEDAA